MAGTAQEVPVSRPDTDLLLGGEGQKSAVVKGQSWRREKRIGSE